MTGRRSRTGSAYWLDYEHAYVTCSQRVHRVGLVAAQAARTRRTCCTAATGCFRTARAAARCSPATSWRRATRTSATSRSTSPSRWRTAPGRELVVWTTTPWTLPSQRRASRCIPDSSTGSTRSSDAGRLLVLADGAGANRRRCSDDEATLGPNTFRARSWSGCGTDRPFDVVPLPPRASDTRGASPADFVTADDGSGIVHMAPAFGADDYAGRPAARPRAAASGRRRRHLHRHHLARDRGQAGHRRGDQRADHPPAQGRRAASAQDRAARSTAIRTAGAASSKLIYYARDSWFVRTSAVKERMLELNAQVQLASAGDRQRAASASGSRTTSTGRSRATATGARRCRSGSATRIPTHVEVIGSYAELAAKLGRPLPDGLRSAQAVHRRAAPGPRRGGGTMRRTPEVIDAWFDSGAMPYAQWHYPFEHEEQFERAFPGRLHLRGRRPDPRLVLLAARDRGDGVRQAPYRNVVVNELVLDAEGQKMSKSRGNVVEPVGGDRASSAPTRSGSTCSRRARCGCPKRFDAAPIPEVAGGFLNTLRNTYEFFALYAGGGAGPRATIAELAARSTAGSLEPARRAPSPR